VSKKETDAVAAVVHLMLAPCLWCWEGFVLTKLWSWHVTDLGLPSIGLGAGVGIMAIAAHLTHQLPPKSGVEASNADNILRLISSALTAALLLLIGWIAA
jgi:hypothetical protein